MSPENRQGEPTTPGGVRSEVNRVFVLGGRLDRATARILRNLVAQGWEHPA